MTPQPPAQDAPRPIAAATPAAQIAVGRPVATARRAVGLSLRTDADRAADALLHRLWLLRGRWRWVVGVEAVLLGAVAGIAVMAIAATASLFLQRMVGAGYLVVRAAIPPAVGTALVMAVHRFRQQRDLATWAAVRAQRHADADGELLRSGIELAHQVLAGGPHSGQLGSPLLLVATLEHASAEVAGLQADVSAIGLRCRRYAGWLALFLALMAVIALRAPLETAQWFTAPADAAQQAKEVGTLVGDQRIDAQAPDYAAAVVPSRREEGGELAALRGSRLTLSALPLAEMQIDSVEVQATGHGKPRSERQPVALQPGDFGAARTAVKRAAGGKPPPNSGAIAWQLTLLETVRYRYWGRDASGQLFCEAGWRELKVIADQPPKASLKETSNEIEVRPGQTLTVRGEVEDDLGLLQVDLVVTRPGNGLERRPVTLPPGNRRAAIAEALAVDTLQLRPGEVAQLHLEASDANPFDSARKGSSDKLRIRMFSAERHHGRVLDAIAALADLWTLRLADRLEQDPAGQKVELAAALKTRASLASQEQQAMDGLRACKQLLADDVVAKPRTLMDLDTIERELHEALSEEAQALARTGNEAGGYSELRDLYALQRVHAVAIAAQERAVAALAALARDEQEALLVREAQRLAEIQQKLLTTLEKLANNDAKPLQAEAERLAEELERQIDRLAAQAQKQAQLMPDEHLNAPAALAGLPRDLGEQRSRLAEVRRLLREGKPRQALDEMRHLNQGLAQALGPRPGDQGARTAKDEALERLVQDLRRGIERGLDGEGRLRDELRSPSEETQRGQEDLLRQVREQVLPQLGEGLRELRDALKSQRMASALLRRHPGLGLARQALESASEAVEKARLDAALQAIAEAQDGVASARRALAQEPADKDTAQDSRRLDAADERLDRAAQRLREAMPEPGELLRPAARARVEAMADQQAQVRLGVERARKRLSDAGDAHPALQRQVGERLDHGLLLMREVEEALRRADAQRAFEQSAEILDALERASDLLKQGGQGSAAAAAPSDSGGPGGQAPVEVSSGQAGDAAEVYRKQVLRAMQRSSPAGWQDRLQRYYKAIAR